MRFNARRLKRFEGSLFHGQIRFYVHVRRGGTFMAEPQCNDCNVYTRLQHVHCSRVSNDVGRDVTLLQLRAAGCGCYGSQLEAICHTCSRHRTAGTIWEERAIAGTLIRSEEHTSELQSMTNLVCRLLLEKK